MTSAQLSWGKNIFGYYCLNPKEENVFLNMALKLRINEGYL